MFKRYLVLLTGLLAVCSVHSAQDTTAPLDRFLSVRTASGTFVQRKTLADVDMTLVSKGTFRFVKNVSLEWKTQQPIESVFIATPEKYTMRAEGKISERNLSEMNLSVGLRALIKGDLTPLETEFSVLFGSASLVPVLKTAKDPAGIKGLQPLDAWREQANAPTNTVFVFVPKTNEVRAFVRWFTLEGTHVPTRFTLTYANGDSLEIDLAQTR